MHQTQINHLQLHTASRGQSATQAKVVRQLRQTRLHPAHLPSSAILVIRRLTQQGISIAPSTNNQRWTRQLQQQVDDHARRAVRPFKQGCADNAPSVLFLDSVELLICFTQDVLAKRDVWYWAELFPASSFGYIHRADLGNLLAIGWSHNFQGVPGMLTRLSQSLAEKALTALNRNQLQQVIRAVHAHFGLRLGESDHQLPTQRESTASIAVPPWQEWLPASGVPTLQPLAIYLLGLSYVLSNAPHKAQSQTFMGDAAQWVEEAERAFSKQKKNLEYSDNHEQQAIQAGVSRYTKHPEAADVNKLPRFDELEMPTDAPRNDDTLQSGLTEQSLQPIEPQIIPYENRQEGDQRLTDELDLNEIQTQLGGAFYLINVIGWLNSKTILFEEKPMNPWIGVAIFMQELLDDHWITYQADPLWDLLDRLGNEVEEISSSWNEQDPNNRVAFERQWWKEQYHQQVYPKLTQQLTDEHNVLIDLFCIPARIVTTNTHIDVTYPAEAVTIEIRRSGLDSSPGWQPMFGFIITFEFGA